MAKYVMVYKTAQPFDMSVLPQEQIAQVMEAWGQWIGSMGAAVVDRGDAFKFGGKSVKADGVYDSDNLMSGYSIVEASDFDEALNYAKGNPVIANGGSVEVYEAFGL